MSRLTSAASINVLMWCMPRYVRPAPTPLIRAVANSGHPAVTFRGYMLTDEDREYLRVHGMPNGAQFAIDESPAPAGPTLVVDNER